MIINSRVKKSGDRLFVEIPKAVRDNFSSGQPIKLFESDLEVMKPNKKNFFNKIAKNF